MSTVVVITPIIIANWPVITAAVTAAVGSLGFAVAQTELQSQPYNIASTAQSHIKTEIEVENAEVLHASVSREEKIVVQKDGITATFSRDACGALKVCMEGHGVSKAELQRIGQELIDRVTQQYAYHRIVTELKSRNMHIVDEEVQADRTVKIRVRNI